MRMRRRTLPVLAAAALLFMSAAQADASAPDAGAVAGGNEAASTDQTEPLSAEPRFQRFETTLARVINADMIERVRAELAPYDSKLAAAAPGSRDQVELAATLALNFARIGDARQAMAPARIAAAGADALWASDPQTAGFAYAAIAQMHAYLGHLLDAQRVAEDGQARWLAAHPRTPEQVRADYADSSRFLHLARIEAQSELLRQCRTHERLGRSERAWLEGRRLRGANAPMSERPAITPYKLGWPEDPRAKYQCGFVMVRYAITPAGATRNVETIVSSGPKVFAEHVERAVLAMAYAPAATSEDTVCFLTVMFALE